jgi:hypothetical protein
VTEAFYTQVAQDRFRSEGHTVGPWSPDAQHFGPPSALLTRALQRLPESFAGSLARVTVEILGPVPITELTVTAEVLRPGRAVELVAATMSAGNRPVATARGWRIAESDTASAADDVGEPLPSPDLTRPVATPEGWGRGGYLDAMEWRSVRGTIGEPGPATLWARQRVALVAGEEPTPWQRIMAVADSGNGASNTLDIAHWLFINSELTVHAHREPDGDWIGLDAHTEIGPHGVGTARSVLHDVHGKLGGGAQALLVRPR